MDNTQLRDELIFQADTAFVTMAMQVNELFDAANEYANANPVLNRSSQIKMADLRVAIADIAKCMKFIAYLVEGWKREDPRIISRNGVELHYLIELRCTIDVTMIFLERENVDLLLFSHDAVAQAHSDLIRCNRLL